jgi:hypothetical protein
MSFALAILRLAFHTSGLNTRSIDSYTTLTLSLEKSFKSSYGWEQFHLHIHIENKRLQRQFDGLLTMGIVMPETR